MTIGDALSQVSSVTRIERPDPAQSHVNPLLRLHLLLYGRYKWAVLLGVLLAACGGTLVWTLMPPKYQVMGYIRVKPYIPPVLSSTDQNGILPMFETFVSLQVSLLQSQRVLNQASLNPEWKALGTNSPRWGQKIPADYLVVEHPKNSEIITVGFADRNVDLAATAVKSIIEAYKATSFDTDRTNDASRQQALEELRTQLSNQKRSLTDQILVLANQYGSDDLQSRHQFKQQQQNMLESELQQVELELSIARAAHGNTASDGPSSQPTRTAPSGASVATPAPPRQTREDVARVDSQMRELLAEEPRLKLRLNQLLLSLGENHPQVVAARAELKMLEVQIDALLSLYQDNAAQGGAAALVPGSNKLSLAELQARETNVRDLFEKVQAETKALGQKDLQIRNLQAERDAISHKLEETAARIDQLNIEAKTGDRIIILSPGERPIEPVASKRIPLTVAVSLLGFAVATGLVALRGYTNRRVSSLLHMQQLAPALRILGILPILPENLEDPLEIYGAAHCVHQIRSLLEALPGNDKGRALAITSPSAGDGKTSLCLALGLSFAASDSRTLLIDCDMVGGGLTRRLNAITRRSLGSILQNQGLLTERQLKEALRLACSSPKKLGEILIDLGYVTAPDIERALAGQKQTSVGLLDALNGEPLANCVSSVVREGLFILPLGEAGPENSSQISAKALRRVIKEARTQYDLIILDTGPLLGSLEASVAVRETDEVILAIARGASSPIVTKTVELLGSLGVNLGGVVLNRATPADVAYSNYGSLGSLRSVRSSDEQRRSTREPRRAAGMPPHLGPLAAAVITSAIAIPNESTAHAHGSSKNGNGRIPPADEALSDLEAASEPESHD